VGFAEKDLNPLRGHLTGKWMVKSGRWMSKAKGFLAAMWILGKRRLPLWRKLSTDMPGKLHHQKKEAARELLRVAMWKSQPLATKSLAGIQGADLATWRDNRLKTVAANTVRLDLALISHLYTIAVKEWNLPVENPCSYIGKPSANRRAGLAPLKTGRPSASLRSIQNVTPS
jgi:hypothetical protein